MTTPESALSSSEYDPSFESLAGLETHLATVFEQRDDLHLPNQEQRIAALFVKESGLGDLVRKEASDEQLEMAVGRVFSWIACVARGSNISIQQALEAKYPAECVYCGQMPCRCNDADRDKATLPIDIDSALPQSLHDWQQHLDEMYGHANLSHTKGIWFTLFRLLDETSEIMTLEMNKRADGLTPDDFKNEYALEIADTAAWLLASANILGVDVQLAVIKKYGNGCVKCGATPCQCGAHYFSADSYVVKK